MNTVFARALVALTLVVLPTSALASTKADKAEGKGADKVEKAKHNPSHSSVAKKEPKTTTKVKQHAHKAKDGKGVAAPTHKAP